MDQKQESHDSSLAEPGTNNAPPSIFGGGRCLHLWLKPKPVTDSSMGEDYPVCQKYDLDRPSFADIPRELRENIVQSSIFEIPTLEVVIYRHEFFHEIGCCIKPQPFSASSGLLSSCREIRELYLQALFRTIRLSVTHKTCLTKNYRRLRNGYPGNLILGRTADKPDGVWKHRFHGPTTALELVSRPRAEVRFSLQEAMGMVKNIEFEEWKVPAPLCKKAFLEAMGLGHCSFTVRRYNRFRIHLSGGARVYK